MAIGRTGSFATTEAPQDRILESMSYVDSLDYRRKQDLAKQAEAQAKAKADKEKEIQADLDKIKTSVTGKKTFDAPAIQAISSLRDGIANKARDYEQGKISKTDYLTYVRNAENSASILNQKAGFINEQGKSFAKMLEEGKLADGFEDGALSFAKAYENGQTVLEDDGNGNLTYVVYGVDEQGNPNSIIEKGGLENFGNTSLTPVLKVDFDKEQKVFKDNNPLGLVESIDGQIKTGVKKVTPTLDSNIRAYAEARLKDKNALLSAYKKATGEADMNVMEDPEKVKIAEDWLYNSIKNSYQEEVTKDEATQRARLGFDWWKAKKDEEINRIQATFDSQLRKDDFTGKTLSSDAVNKNMIAIPDNELKFKNLGGSQSGLNDGYVTGFGLQKDGTVIVTGKALIDKGQKFKVGNKTVGLGALQDLANQGNQEAQIALDSYSTAGNYGRFRRIVSGTELAGLAEGAGYGSVKELKSELQTINNNPEEKPKSSGVSWK